MATASTDLVEALEVRFLANRDHQLHFGLLTDFADAHAETLPGDEALLRRARSGIEALNAKYPRALQPGEDEAAGDTFFLFHRPRRFNPQERIWMGYERKRGKLADLNALLRGDGAGRFALVVGDTVRMTRVRYVITLDTDTQLPRDAARRMASVMAHPLNRARGTASGEGDGGGPVTHGYAILQPRVSASLPATNRSWYARLHGGDPGVDPYTRAVSDVYQDVFGEGSFIGKGIYDVDAFERALGGRFPENRILSHDLLEGCYARSGLLSDVEVYEDYPADYGTDVRRRHRWIRGDWQLLAWLLPRVPGPAGRRLPNPMSALSRWKLFDNLRRSLVPAALTLLLLLGWTVLAHPWLWTLAVLAILLLPSASAVLAQLAHRPDEVSLRQHLAAVASAAGWHGAQAALTLAFLPYEATVNLDAALRALWRTFVSHRLLLEWNPSAADGVDPRRSPPTLASMWIAPVTAVATAAVLAVATPAALVVAAPILLLWFLSPGIAAWISRPLPRREARLTADQTLFLRRLARRTWAFFETYVGEDDHWLPPDNVQEHPALVVAHRTSPTNMGLALLANLTACDMGYIPAGQFILRTANALDAMKALDRHEGHFYNWYDTRSGAPLPPHYVSSVDSGNLAGHLMTLRPGLLALADDPIMGVKWFEGLGDVLGCLSDAAGGVADAAIVRLRRELESAYDARPVTIAAARVWLDRLDASVGAVAARMAIHATPDAAGAAATDPAFWTDALVRQMRSMQRGIRVPRVVEPAAGRTGRAFGADSMHARFRRCANSHRSPRIRGRPTSSRGTRGERRRASLRLRRSRKRAVAPRTGSRKSTAWSRVCEELACMEYDFLYDKARHLLAIGYNVEERRRDASYYDLLASEARLCSFVAIAQGRLPEENWFALGRLLANAGGQPVLLSWSGSMFEYLMPLLVMPAYENTLLDQTCRATVDRQIAYGRQRGVPWGISECGYNAVDASLNYQYRAFGVPGLGLKRGLAEDLVVAPYASALALMVAPEAACLNLQRLSADGLAGRFGLFEAIDYTPARVPRGQVSAIVRSFMAHHQGMILLSLAHLLLARPMQKRFESDPLFKSTLLLLQERIPKAAALHPQPADVALDRGLVAGAEAPVRVLATPDTPIPEVQLLSNGRYHVMVTNAGGGSSRWKDLAVTRWREDTTCDHWGTFCYIRDVASGEFWSAAHQPTRKQPEQYEAIFTEARAEFRRRDNGFETHTEIVVSPEDDIELRRVRITNRARTRRTIDVTSYAEVVLAPPAADALHPAFSNLFVQTEIIAARQALLCTRRPRSQDESPPWMLHLMAVHGVDAGEVSFETDRMAFIGRGRTVAAPQAMVDAGPLAGHHGSVLDPIVAIRHRLTLDPQETATIDIVSGVAETRDAALSLVEKYQDRHLADRVYDLAWTHGSVTLRQINVTESDAQLYARLAGAVIYANASLRAEAGVIARNRRGQSGLWSYAISGDLPIVLLQIGDTENIDLVRRMVQAHAYWRLKGLAVDLVIWNEDRGGYRQVLQDQIMGLIAAGIEAHVMDRPGGIFVRRAEQIADEDRILLQSVARAIITDRRGSLVEQVGRRSLAEVRVPRLAPTRVHRAEPSLAHVPARDLVLTNGLGGFTPDGREYVVTTLAGQTTPAPWSNVLANPDFGTVISESGLAYTWSENAHEFRLTPWHNDPVSDASGEAFFVRDEESGHVWSPAALPRRGTGAYVTRHGFGYSVFEHDEDGIVTELTVFVALDAPVKFSVLKVRNASGRARRLSITGYVEWVLGDLRPKTAMHVITEVDLKSGALLARNAYNAEFPDRVAFLDVDDPARTVTGDRTEFLGRNGTLRAPAALARARLSGRTGAALDPCGAIQVTFDLADGEERDVVFRLGVGRHAADAGSLVQRFRGSMAAQVALAAVHAHWTRTLGVVQVTTPDPRARRAGERLAAVPDAGVPPVGAQRLLPVGRRVRVPRPAAGRHGTGARRARARARAPRAVRGTPVRRRRRPALVASAVGPRRAHAVLRRLPVAAVRDRALRQRDRRRRRAGRERCRSSRTAPSTPTTTRTTTCRAAPRHAGSVYEHCVRAIRNGLRFGAHGMPLMGSGDWNDGMNLVGIKGEGESVWLGFFLCAVLRDFVPIARMKGDAAFVGALRGGGTSGFAATSSSTAGTANGTGARTSTTGRRWARQATSNAASIPSRRAGPCCPARVTRVARAPRCRPSTRISCAAPTR